MTVMRYCIVRGVPCNQDTTRGRPANAPPFGLALAILYLLAEQDERLAFTCVVNALKTSSVFRSFQFQSHLVAQPHPGICWMWMWQT